MTAGFECWILPHESADGPVNMAGDEAMLEFAAIYPDQALFRTYEWSTPTLSLGYFQSIKQAEAEDRFRGYPTVRRPTGGGALWHDREVTYSLVLPRRHPLSARAAGLYEVAHQAIVQILATHGVMSRRRRSVELDPQEPEKPFLCFRDQDPNDVVLDGHKIVGSAQRRRSGAVLQHGSILIGRSSQTNELPGISDLSENHGSLSEWKERIEAKVPELLGLAPRHVEWPSFTVKRAQVLAKTVYENEAWTRRR